MAPESKFVNKKVLKKLILLTLRDATIATILLSSGLYFSLYLFGIRLFVPRFKNGYYDKYFDGKPVKPSYTIEQKLSTEFNKTNRNIKAKQLKKILLIIVYNFPHYRNFKYINALYKHVFSRVVSCGSIKDEDQPEVVVPIAKGYFGYACAAAVMEKYDAEGYLYSNDDMIINWWTLTDLSSTKIWHGTKFIDYSTKIYSEDDTSSWKWWNTHMGKAACQRFYEMLMEGSARNSSSNLRNLFSNYIDGCNGSPCCGKGWSDFFYIPYRFKNDFVHLSKIAHISNLFLEIAVPNIFLSLVHYQDDIIVVPSIYLFDYNVPYFNTNVFWEFYNFNITFIHPFKFHLNKENHGINIYMLKKYVIPYGKKLIQNHTDRFE